MTRERQFRLMKTDFHFLNGGKFISRGRGRHPVRVLDSAELICVLSGRLGICEEDAEYDIAPGGFLILHPGRRHGGTKPYAPGLSFFWAHFRGERTALDRLPSAGRVARPESFSLYFERLLAEQKVPGNGVTCDLLLALLLNEADRGLRRDPQPQARDRLAEEARCYLRLHFPDEVSIAAMAAELRCNPDYLGRVFRRRFGCTPIHMLNRIRLEKAAALLRDSPLSVKEAGFLCGFNDPAHFRRQFFRAYSMRPSVYRKIHGAVHVNTE